MVKQNNANRNEKHQKYIQLLNTKEWRTLRAEKIRENQGLCEWCKRDGYITAAKTVHHLRPVETGKTDEEMRALCFDKNNTVLLCKECHHKAHQLLHSHQGQTIRQMPKADTPEGSEQLKMKEWIEHIGGTYQPPVKKGIRKTRFGWVTQEEYDQKQKAEFEQWKQKINGPTDTIREADVDAGAED